MAENENIETTDTPIEETAQVGKGGNSTKGESKITPAATAPIAKPKGQASVQATIVEDKGPKMVGCRVLKDHKCRICDTDYDLKAETNVTISIEAAAILSRVHVLVKR